MRSTEAVELSYETLIVNSILDSTAAKDDGAASSAPPPPPPPLPSAQLQVRRGPKHGTALSFGLN